MRRRTPLPPRLGMRFTVGAAAGIGVSRRRRDAGDLARPFHGVRATTPPENFRARADCLTVRLRPDQRYGGPTAARLWGLPVPAKWTYGDVLHVYVPTGASRPRTVGVKGFRLAPARLTCHVRDNLRMLDPIGTLFTCAKDLTLAQAVTMIDAVLTTADNYPGLRADRPFISRDDITERLAEWGAFPGCRTIRAALDLAREKVESPKETETRLLMRTYGLPEPVVQHEICDGLRLVARVDLAYPELKVAIEYEGDEHRTDKRQWRRDIQRQRELEARGWVVIRLTQEDLDFPVALINRIRNAIASR